MKIQYCSDLHLEFAANRAWLEDNPIIPVGNILLIAGDTYYLNRSYHKLDCIKHLADQFERVYLIPGNHEYYDGFDIATALRPSKEPILDNVWMVNNTSETIEGVQFIFSTFWATITTNVLEVMRGMMDFHRITFDGKPFSVNHFNELHEKAFEFVANEVKSNHKKVVVTHHLPSFECNAPEFKNSLLNEAFCVDKTNFISDSNIDYWIYGHSHRNLADIAINGTQLLTNQMGYVAWGEHKTFVRDKVFEIEP